MKFKQIFESNKSAGMSIEDIAAKHSVSVEMIKSQIQLGLKVEKEHTDDIAVAMQITLDHLTELPDYYSRLDKMETESITEAKVTTTDGHTFKSPKEAYKAMLLGGSDDDEIMTALPDIKLPAHKYYLRIAKKELGKKLDIVTAVKTDTSVEDRIKAVKKKLKVGDIVKIRSYKEDGVVEELYPNNFRVRFPIEDNAYGITYDRVIKISKPKKLKPKSNKIKYHKNISFENAKKLFDKAGDSYSEFIVGATDRSGFVVFHTTSTDGNGMQFGHVDDTGIVDSWGPTVKTTGDMKEAKKLGIKWILDELVVTDEDTPYEPAYPRKKFVVFETKNHRGETLFITIDGGSFIKAMPVPKGWKDGKPATFEEY